MTTITCHICGTREDLDPFCEEARNEMMEHKECFDCNHFMRLFRQIDPNDLGSSIRVDGVHYQAGDYFEPKVGNGIKGYGGSPFVFKFKDGTIRCSTDVWCQGDIPVHLKDKLPDNAEVMEYNDWPEWVTVRRTCFMDNSVEEYQYNPKTRRNRTIVMKDPSGDACF